MLDHTKTLKQEGENGSLRNAAMSAFEEGTPFMGTALAAHKQPQWPGCFCKKMCCPNGSRKLHFVQKIRLDLNKFGAGWIFRTKCVFLQVLNLHIFLQKQPGHWGRGCLHFHLSFISFICSPKGNGNFGRIAERSRFSCHKLENYRIRRDE